MTGKLRIRYTYLGDKDNPVVDALKAISGHVYVLFEDGSRVTVQPDGVIVVPE